MEEQRGHIFPEPRACSPEMHGMRQVLLLIGLLFVYIQSDEDTLLKVDEVSKTEAQAFDVFDQLVSSFQFCV